MAKPTKPKRKMADKQLYELLDGIKDEIDTLHQIANLEQRHEAARDLVEYLELHYEAP
jgi:hypothetical protein